MGYSLEELDAELARRGENPAQEQAPQQMQGQEMQQPEDGMGHFRTHLGSVAESLHKLPAGILESAPVEALFPQLARGSRELGQQLHNTQQAGAQQNPMTAGVSGFAGDVYRSLPFYAAAGMAKLPQLAARGMSRLPYGASAISQYLAKMAGHGGHGALAEGAIGLTEKPGDDQSRFSNAFERAKTGGAYGAAIPVVGDALGYLFGKTAKPAWEYVKQQFGNKDAVSKKMLEGLLQTEVDRTLSSKAAANRLGLNVTPAEASGNPLLASKEADIGISPEAAKNKYAFKKGQKGVQKAVIEDFKTQISPSPVKANESIRDAAKKIIDKKIQARQEKAEPFYEKAASDSISHNKLNSLLKDANIQEAFARVTDSKLYADRLKGVPQNSVKVLDQVKKAIDDDIRVAVRKGQNDKAGILIDAKGKLVTALDKVSPDYRKARKIFADDSPAIDALRESKIGKLSSRSGEDLKNISKDIFDTNQTDPKVFEEYRNKLYRENPGAWKNIVRDEMERRMSQSQHLSKTENYGSEFYDKILSKDRDYDQFLEALGRPGSKGYTPEQQKLIDLRKAFKGLINSRTGKTAYGQAETSMSKPRDPVQAIILLYKKFLGGKFDKAALEFITNDKWDEAVKRLGKEPDPGKLMNLLNKINEESALSKSVFTPEEGE